MNNNENKNIEAANPQGIRNDKTRRLVMLALWAALTVILAFVPNLGYIYIGIFTITTVHIPVIIGAILLGPLDGAILGFIFGLTSVIHATFQPPATAFLFSPFVPFGNFNSLIIAIVPRVLVGVVAAYLFRFIRIKDKKGYIASLVAAIVSSLTNSVFVLGLAFLLFGKQFAAVNQKTLSGLFDVILFTIATSGVAEAITAAIVVTAAVKAITAAMKRI